MTFSNLLQTHDITCIAHIIYNKLMSFYLINAISLANINNMYQVQGPKKRYIRLRMYINAHNKKNYRVLNKTKWKICIHEKRFLSTR